MAVGTRIAMVLALIAAVAGIVISAAVFRGVPGNPPLNGLPHPFAPSGTGQPGGVPVPGTAVPRYPPISPPPSGHVDCARARCVALTFDDGPSAYTTRLLNILDAHHAKATFFDVGARVLAFPQTVRRAYREGFAIGDHSVTHPRLTRLPVSRARAEIQTAAQEIAQVTGHAPSMLRPPFGAQNPRVRALAGMPLILWNVSARDWKVHNADVIRQRVLAAVRPGAIVLLHDIYWATVKAVARIVDTLRGRGYTLVTVPEMFADTGLRPGVAYVAGPSALHLHGLTR